MQNVDSLFILCVNIGSRLHQHVNDLRVAMVRRIVQRCESATWFLAILEVLRSSKHFLVRLDVELGPLEDLGGLIDPFTNNNLAEARDLVLELSLIDA